MERPLVISVIKALIGNPAGRGWRLTAHRNVVIKKGGGDVTDYRKLFDLGGKTAVVLGAASGIGKSPPITQRPDIYKLYAGHTVFNRWSSPVEVATAVAVRRAMSVVRRCSSMAAGRR